MEGRTWVAVLHLPMKPTLTAARTPRCRRKKKRKIQTQKRLSLTATRTSCCAQSQKIKNQRKKRKKVPAARTGACWASNKRPNKPNNKQGPMCAGLF